MIIGSINDVSDLVGQNIELSKTDWDFFETSWDFKRHKAVTLALQNIIIGRNTIQPQRMYVYTDSDLLTPVMEVDL